MNMIYLKVRLLLGVVSLVVGLLAANFALFGWQFPEGVLSFLGDYAYYACAYGGFAAIVFGSMLMNDFFVWRSRIIVNRESKRKSIFWLIRARMEWQLGQDFVRFCSVKPSNRFNSQDTREFCSVESDCSFDSLWEQ